MKKQDKVISTTATATATTTTKAKPPVGPRTSPVALRQLGTASNKAMKTATVHKGVENMASHANTNLTLVKSLLAKKNNGKLSRFGHNLDAMNGILDEMILSSDTVDFGVWLKAMAKGNCKSRRSDVNDNKKLAKRLREHIMYLGGTTNEGLMVFPKRLKRVELESKAKEIMAIMHPLAVLCDEWYKKAAF